MFPTKFVVMDRLDQKGCPVAKVIKVLIVEDDLLIADMVEDRLLTDGFTVCGIAINIAEGIALAIQHKPDVALVDVRLDGGDLGTTLGVELKRLGNIAILYATGNIDLVLVDKTMGEACLKKPYSMDGLAKSIRLVNQLLVSGPVTKPYPEGFIVLKKCL
jgi:DNA-binding response OmpR family regulator